MAVTYLPSKNTSQQTGDWLKVDPNSGDGDGSFAIAALSANTGRAQKAYGNGTSTGVKVTAGSVTKYVKVTQAGKAEFVSIDQTSYSPAYNATSVTITGKSNSKNLSFSLSGNNEVTAAGTKCRLKFFEGTTDKGVTYKSESSKNISFQAVSSSDTTGIKFTAAGSAQKGGVDMSGDPGNTAEYSFSITLEFDTANTGSTIEQATLVVTGNSGNSDVKASTTIKRNAASVFLGLYKEAAHTNAVSTVELVAAGTAKSTYVDSNGSWSITGA